MQIAIVLFILATALAYLGWRAARIIRGTGKPGCASGCGSCPSAKTPNVVPLEVRDGQRG